MTTRCFLYACVPLSHTWSDTSAAGTECTQEFAWPMCRSTTGCSSKDADAGLSEQGTPKDSRRYGDDKVITGAATAVAHGMPD